MGDSGREEIARSIVAPVAVVGNDGEGIIARLRQQRDGHNVRMIAAPRVHGREAAAMALVTEREILPDGNGRQALMPP